MLPRWQNTCERFATASFTVVEKTQARQQQTRPSCGPHIPISLGQEEAECSCNFLVAGPHGSGCEEGSGAVCEDSEFGCCPDGVTPAEGPGHSGCNAIDASCAASFYGCCPDGVKAARGPGFQGCPGVLPHRPASCANSLHGCCPDGQTPASGPEHEGCDGPVQVSARRSTKVKDCVRLYFSDSLGSTKFPVKTLQLLGRNITRKSISRIRNFVSFFLSDVCLPTGCSSFPSQSEPAVSLLRNFIALNLNV